MANLNKVMLIGNLTRDPEVKYTPKGTAVTDIGLAINRVYSTDGGEKREETTFIDVTLWGRTAEVVNQYCKKGSPLFVEGRLQLDTWEDKQSGQKRSKLRVVGEGIQLLGAKGSGGGGSHSSHSGGDDEPQARQTSSRPTPPRQEPSAPAEDDDIPF
jgi:single-strand DNA-binding protein